MDFRSFFFVKHDCPYDYGLVGTSTFSVYTRNSDRGLCFNPIQDGEGGAKRPPTSFFPVTSTNVGMGPYNFLTFSFNPFGTLVQNFKFLPSASPKLLNLNQDHPSKKAIFLVKSL